MPKIGNEIIIDRRPDEVWAILGDLGAVTRWVPGVASARMEGMRRICTLEDGGEIREGIADFSDERAATATNRPCTRSASRALSGPLPWNLAATALHASSGTPSSSSPTELRRLSSSA